MTSSANILLDLPAIEAEIRAGRTRRAQSALEAMIPASVPREQKAKFASMARRVSLPYLAMRLLHPLVRANQCTPQPASSEEICEYAACLTYVGAPGEAIELLDPIQNYPPAYLYQAFAHFSRWDYAAALPSLERYLESEGLSDYERLVGHVNQIAALIAEKMEGVPEALEKAIWSARKQGAEYLLGSLYELQGQWAIAEQRWEEAESALLEAESLFQNRPGWYSFFVRKWQTILRVRRGKDKPEAFEGLRIEAAELQHWESVRDCDLYQTLAEGTVPRSLHLYFGTPFPAFRQRLLKEHPGLVDRLPPHFDWGGDAEEAPLIWDPLHTPESRLPGGPVLLSLFQVLQTDFYRPLRTATLFLKLFPDEHFNPDTAPARVHEAVRRLRQWFRKTRKPLQILEADGGYRLQSKKPIRLRVYASQPVSLSELRLAKLSHAFPTQSFSTAQASGVLGLGARSINRLMSEWQDAQLIQSSGRGKNVRYVLTIKK